MGVFLRFISEFVHNSLNCGVVENRLYRQKNHIIVCVLTVGCDFLKYSIQSMCKGGYYEYTLLR